MFEIALRNAIHNHYSQQFNDKDWIVNSTAPGKLLAYDAKEIAEAQNEYRGQLRRRRTPPGRWR